MNRATNSYPPGEAPEAEAREEARLARELKADDAPLDIGLDEAPAEPGSLARGAEAVRAFWKHAPDGSGRLSHDRAEGEVLYVGKARSIKKRIAAYTAPERQPNRIARMVAQTALDGLRLDRDRGRGAAARSQSHQAAQAALQRAAARRQELPLHPHQPATIRRRSSPSIAARATIKGDYFGPFASAGAVHPHAERAAARLSPAHLLGQLLRATARGPACCTRSSAARRPARARSRSPTMPSSWRRRATSSPAAAARCAQRLARGDERGLGRARIREGGAPARPHRGALGDSGRAERQSALDRRGRRLRGHRGGRAVLRRGRSSSAPTRTGATAPIFRAPTGRCRPRRCSTPSSRSSISNAPRRASCCSATTSRARRSFARFSPAAPDAASPSARRSAAKSATLSKPRCATPARRCRASSPRRASQEKLLAALGQAFGVERPMRRVEVYDNSHIMGTNAIGAMIVAGPEGFVKNQYRTFNIKSADLTPGDDYAMMREVLTRRFARLLKREGETAEPGGFPDTPDLVLIDGGRGQFEAAREVMTALGVEGVTLASIAKGPDRERRPRDLLRRGPRAVQAVAARPGALLRAAAARRGAPLRHRHASRPAQEGVREEPARRDPRHRARRASARCCTPSARPRRSRGRASPISKRRRGSTPRPRRRCTTSFTRRDGGEPPPAGSIEMRTAVGPGVVED